ncbi:MAG: DUF3137 domain-containing protein [Rhizobiaceae bacterium]
MDASAFMPGEAVQAAIRDDLVIYNEQRAAAIARVAWRRKVILGGYAVVAVMLLAAFAFWLFGGPAPAPEVVGGVDINAASRDGPLLVFGLAGVFSVVVGIFVYYLTGGPVRKLQRNFRRSLIPRLFAFLENVTYRQGAKPASFRNLPRQAIGNYNRQRFDDVIAGGHQGMKFEAFEASFSRQKDKKADVRVFSGIILSFDLTNPFPGKLIATRGSRGVMGSLGDLFSSLGKVTTGDPSLDESYEFRSDNPEAAVKLVNKRFVEALDGLHATWPGSAGRVVLAGNSGFVLLPTSKNFFELPKIDTACEYDRHIKPMVTDMAGLLATAKLVRAAA